MVREAGMLVSKDRFLDEVWRGVPVTDEALTQCIKALRRALGDEAASPRFIATVPKHGYRFIAPVAAGTAAASRSSSAPAISMRWR
jgi:DNA-binding winged helix-turn-helix (wHTH) protein